jgi:hypothetical protein
MDEDISESHFPRRPRSLSFYLVLFLVVLPFWSLVPLAWTFALYSLYSYNYRSYGLASCALFSLACCEVLPFLFLDYILTYLIF